MEMFNNSCQVEQLGQTVQHHMLAYLWIKQRNISLKVKNFNRWSGFDILMTSFLFGIMVNRSFSGFFKNLIKLILTRNLRMSRVKKRFHSWIYLLVYVMGTFIQISILKLLIGINISNTRHLTQNTLRNPSLIVRFQVEVGFAHLSKNLKGTKEI